jgi:hypothetical protein
MPHLVSQVAELVNDFARRLTRVDGSPARAETYWLYTGRSEAQLDAVWFGKTLGFAQESAQQLFDKAINLVDHTFTSLAIHLASGRLGVHITTAPSSGLSESVLHLPPQLFLFAEELFVLDGDIATYIAPAERRYLSQTPTRVAGGSISQDLTAFILSHPKRVDVTFPASSSLQGGSVAYVPGSLLVDLYGTKGSCHLTRGYFEPIVRHNKFDGGSLLADGHIHRSLTAQQISGNAWLADLARRYGPVQAANTLSLQDVEWLMGIEHIGKYYNVPEFQFAARELYVLDNSNHIVAHSVLNMVAIMNDDSTFERFVDVAKKALGSPNDAQLRMAFHDMLQDLTTKKEPLDPLSPTDYA